MTGFPSGPTPTHRRSESVSGSGSGVRGQVPTRVNLLVTTDGTPEGGFDGPEVLRLLTVSVGSQRSSVVG